MSRTSIQTADIFEVEADEELEAPADLTDEVEVGDDLDAWMNDMLAGPSENEIW